MNRILCSLVALAATSALVAQDCNNLGTALGVGDDTVFGIQPIGFAFPLNGTTYTDAHVCTNGFVWLSNAGVPAAGAANYTATTAEFVAQGPRVAPLWTDLNIIASNGGQCYINSGATECKITWKNAVCFGQTTIFDVQCVLRIDGSVEYRYGPGVTNNGTFGLGYIAIVGATPGGGVVLPAASDLSAGGATADPTIFEEFQLGTFDMANNSLLLIATSPGYAFTPLGANTNCASKTTYGTGCVNQANNFYELFGTAAAFDLNGATISMLRNPSGYLVLNAIPGTYVPPSGTAAIVANGDDVTTTVALSGAMPVAGGTPTSSLVVCSNGHIALSGVGNGTAYTPAAATFLGWANNSLAPAFHDFNPSAAGSGKVYFEEIGGIAYVTWDNVFNFGQTTGVGNTFQVQFNVGTGDITIVYQALNGLGNGILTGYKVGGAANNLGSTDLSSALAGTISVFDSQVTPLGLAMLNSPIINSTNFQFDVTNVPPILPVAFVGFGDTVVNPGLDIGFIGMPGCRAYTNLNLGLYQTAPVAGTTGSFTLPIPNDPTIVGTLLSAQGVAFSLATPLNLIASNGGRFMVGY
jgi:hypothetical protein